MTQDRDNFRADMHADEDLVPFDVRDYSGRRAMWLLFLVIALLLLAAFIVFKLYQPGVRDRDAPPQIIADSTPYKVEPKNPGGEVTPNQDKSVYDVMNGTAKDETVVAAPQPENPVNMPKSATIVVQDNPVQTTRPAPRPQAPTPRPAPAQTQSTGSQHVVQVASVRSREDAEALWVKIKRNSGSLMPASSFADIKRADLGDKGVFYRLRVAGLANKSAASQLCGSLKAQGQACFVTLR